MARGNRIRIANSLTLETNDKLEFYAYKLGLTKSAIVTMAVNEWISNRDLVYERIQGMSTEEMLSLVKPNQE